MDLLSSLNSGFPAAANGTASIFVRGSSTRATWYATLEGDGSDSTGEDITLDAHGSALVYVDQLVDVVIKDADGVAVRSYGDGQSAPNIEVRSQSFTGIDYTTAASAAENPTTLQAVMDLWKTNSGAIDWKVLLNSTATTLQVALGSLNGLVFNVKSPAYGATGDGVTDDRAAVVAAVAAAVAYGGGTVYFPAGTYRITSVITWDYRVHIIMCPGASLAIDHATEKTIKFTGANSTAFETIFFGLAFKALQANTGVSLSLEADQKLRLIECQWGVAALDTGTNINIAATVSRLVLQGCRSSLNATGQAALARTSGSVTDLRVLDSQFVLPAVYTVSVVDTSGFAAAADLIVRGCLFDATTNSTTTGGSYQAIRVAASSRVVIVGNNFTGTFTYAILFDTWTGVVTQIAANKFVSVSARYSIGGVFAEQSWVELEEHVRASTASNAITIPNGVHMYAVKSTGTVPTITMPTGYYPGQEVIILVYNNSGANWAAGISFSGMTKILFGTIDPVNTARAYIVARFTDLETSGTYLWYGLYGVDA